MKKKLRSKRAFTLMEGLVVIAVLALMCAALAVGIPATYKAYDNVTTSSEANVLASTLSEAVSGELRFASSVGSDGSYDSQTYGAGAKLSPDGSGRIQVTSGGKSYALVSSKTYTSGLTAELEYPYIDGAFSVKITIMDSEGMERAKAEFSIDSLNA